MPFFLVWGKSFVQWSWHRFSGRKLPGNLVRGEFIASKPIQPVIRLLRFDRWIDYFCTLCEMESQPAPNILHDQPLNNVVKKDFYFCSKLLRSKITFMCIEVKKDSIHVEALRKEWLGVEHLAKAEPKYHFNPFKK